ncbi:hypothetical protein KI387_001430 [Taxus chinensis]|uniref:Tify domain-containing protein n=1 Tax=Taxus chinensis TaxID=29808 RepID=A0AA38GV24_TAXCH|nr:hypothetical protein KI387_001430 [Taxus chinensis]
MEALSIYRGGKLRVPEPRAGMQGLSWIKPEMMQQVLSSIVRPQEQIKVHSQAELMDLFRSEREHDATLPLSDRRSVSETQDKQSTTQLTIFYNGAVNVYNVSAEKGEAILQLASNNSLGKTASHIASGEIKEEILKPSARLPMARKLSLQRFLQKRKDRLSTAAPYNVTSTSNTPLNVSTSTTAKDKNSEEHVRLSLSFPSQRSC